MKIAINVCFGGFSVSEEVYKELGIKWDGYGFLGNKDFGICSDDYLAFRSNTKFIEAIEKVGINQSSGCSSKIKIIDIPGGIDYYIDDFDGNETIHEIHNSWR
jgi:hypothetical protein